MDVDYLDTQNSIVQGAISQSQRNPLTQTEEQDQSLNLNLVERNLKRNLLRLMGGKSKKGLRDQL